MKENIIIFGASTRGVYVYERLKNNFHIQYFCDNDIKKHGTKINNIEIISPEKLSGIKDCKIIIASMYSDEICQQLSDMGIINFEAYPSNAECAINGIENRDINLKNMNALEVFGGNGKSVDIYILEKVKRLEVWEIDESRESELKSNLTGAEIKIVDSFKQIKKTKSKYDIIIMDNPMAMFGSHCEHFDMFIDIFNVVKHESIIILDIIPKLESIPCHFESLKDEIHLLCRKLFYRAENPLNIPVDEIIYAYENIINRNGYTLEWSFVEERSRDFIYYLVLKIKKSK